MKQHVPLGTKVLYGSGAIADGVKNHTFNTFLLFFYTQVAGLSGTLAGVAIFTGLIVDALTDPLIGNISDHFRSQWGRRHPFMYAAAVPMALCFMALFNPPDDFGELSLFAWMLVFVVGVRFSMTLYSIPSNSLVAEMTPNYDERTSLVSFRVLSGWIGGLVAAQAGYLYYFAPSADFPDGRLDASAYSDYVFAGGIVIFLAIMTCALGTHRMIPRLFTPPGHTPFSVNRFVTDLKDVLRTRSYLIIVVTILVAATATGFTDNIGLYMNTYFWEFSAFDISFTIYGAIVGMVLAFGFTPLLANRTDKPNVAIAAVAAILLIAPLPVVSRLLDLIPANGDPVILPMIVVWTAIIVFVAVTVQIVLGSMIADTIDESELSTGKRQEGMFNSAFTLMSKATSSVGGLIAGITIDVIDLPTGAAVGEVNSDILVYLGLAAGPGVMIFWLLALLVLRHYPLTRDKHRDIIAQLTARHG